MQFSRNHEKRRRRKQHSVQTSRPGARRLRAEFMENRMMLSATAAAFESSFPTSTENEIEVVQGMFRAAQSMLTVSFGEGGYIGSSGQGVTNDAIRNSDYQPPTIGDLLDFEATSTNPISDSDGFLLFGTDGFVGREVEYPFQLVPALASIARGNSELGVPVEGGWIAVKPLLESPPGVSVELRVEKSAPAAPSVKTLLGSTGNIDQPTDTAGSPSQVSGEWARAAVFEVVGGEPTASSVVMRSVPSEFVPAPASSSDASAVDSPAVTEAVFESDSASEASSTPPSRGEAIETEASTIESRTPLAEVVPQAAFDDSVTLNRPQSDASFGNSAPRSEKIENPLLAPTEDDLAAAFDEIGKAELTADSSSVVYRMLNRSLSATPLLLVFALERVTARRSRTPQASELIHDGRRRPIQ